MYWFVFDLDQTLAELYTPYWFLYDLKFSYPNKQTVDPDTLNKMNKAYTLFVKLIAEKEASSEPLGILRPGILDIMRLLKQLKDKDIFYGVVIYSNNTHLDSLHFVRDIIHEVIQDTTLICDCIHWGHPARISEINPTNPGSGKKTWKILSKIMTNGPCHAKNLDPKNVYFADDYIPPHDIINDIGSDHYFIVKPYTFITNFKLVRNLWKKAILESFNTKESLDKWLFLTQYSELNKKIPILSLNKKANLYLLNTRKAIDTTHTIPSKDTSIELIESFLYSMIQSSITEISPKIESISSNIQSPYVYGGSRSKRKNIHKRSKNKRKSRKIIRKEWQPVPL